MVSSTVLTKTCLPVSNESSLMHAEEALERQLAANAWQQTEILELKQQLAVYTEFCVCLDQS
jgi:hypothetical protein